MLLAATKAKQVIALETNSESISRINDNMSLNEGSDKIITVLNIEASNKKPVAALDKRESRIMDRVLDMPESKTDAEVIRILENSGYKMTNSIRKAKLLTMSTPIPSSLSIFAYFLILLILVVAGFTYWLCYRPDYLSKKHYP